MTVSNGKVQSSHISVNLQSRETDFHVFSDESFKSMLKLFIINIKIGPI